MLLLFALLCAFCLPAAQAQNTNASLNGAVSDATGAAIPGATVTAVSNDTGASHTATASGEGTYTLTALPPGTYTITTKKNGFTANVQDGMVLSVGEAASVKTILTVGSTNETVTVSATGSVINQTTAELSELVNEHSVKELPLNGRDPSSLVLLAPGTTNILSV